MQQNVIRCKMLGQQDAIQYIKYRKAYRVLIRYSAQNCLEKCVKWYTNSLEKCVEGDDIYQEKCEMIMGYGIKGVECIVYTYNVRHNI